MPAPVVIHIETRRRSSRRLKVFLATLIVIGGIASLTISGTYALLTSQETNATGNASSGTLTIGDNVDNSATTCFSYGSGSTSNVNDACDPLMTSSPLEYPGSTATASVAITNNGTVAGNDLVLFMPSCTASSTTGATVVGGGNPCTELTDSGGNPDGLQLIVQETDSLGNPIACWYPIEVPSNSCSSDSTDLDAALPNSFPLFAEYATSFGASVDLGSTDLAPGQTRYFTIELIMPNDADNSLQGEQATFTLTWHMTT